MIDEQRMEEVLNLGWLTGLHEHILFWPLVMAFAIVAVAWLLRRPLAWVLGHTIAWLLHAVVGVDHRLQRDSLQRPLRGLVMIIALYIALAQVPFHPKTDVIVLKLWQSLLTINLFSMLMALIPPTLLWERWLNHALTRPMIAWLIKLGKGLIMFTGLAIVLDLWGIQIGPILAGFGLVGAAVALGAQDLFKNLIAGALIIIEKRFDIGDAIEVSPRIDGDVERIGLRSTLIRRYDKSPLYVPNTQLADAALINTSRMAFRRIQLNIGLDYSTTSAQLKEIRAAIKTYLNESPDFVDYDESAAFVGLDSFTDHSLNFLVQCFTPVTKWQPYMRLRAQLAGKLQEVVEQAGAKFARPSQVVYIQNADGTTNTNGFDAAMRTTSSNVNA